MFKTNHYGRIMKTDVSDISTLDIYCKNAATVKMDYENVITLKKRVQAEIDLGLHFDFFDVDDLERFIVADEARRAAAIAANLDINASLEPEKAVELGIAEKVREAMIANFHTDSMKSASTSVQEECMGLYNEAQEKLDKDKKILEELKPLVIEKYGLTETELDEKIDNTEVILPPPIIKPSVLPGY